MKGKDPDLCWNEERKRDEMTDARAWYLIARTQEGTPVAFSHFRLGFFVVDFSGNFFSDFRIS